MKNWFFLSCVFILMGCGGEDIVVPSPSPTLFSLPKDSCIVNEDNWALPVSEVIDSGVGKDGIPALETPLFVQANEVNYLNDRDLVLGLKTMNGYRAYPHKILDKHEIINDTANGKPIAITFCPLTGTGIGWERSLNGQITTLGVSGLLYNSNLIIYDRLTNSHWSQFWMRGIEGDFICEKPKTFQLIETSWGNWKQMFPETKVLSKETGFNFPYNQIAFSGIVTESSSLAYPVTPFDTRINKHTRGHGIISKGEARVYFLSHFHKGTQVVQEDLPFLSDPVVIIGNESRNFIVSYFSILPDGSGLDMTPIDDNSAVIMEDQLGNKWDIWGTAIEGPNSGTKLKPTLSLMGYWFAWGAFYPTPEIYDGLSTKDG